MRSTQKLVEIYNKLLFNPQPSTSKVLVVVFKPLDFFAELFATQFPNRENLNNFDKGVGRRGLVGLFVNKFTMTPRVEGSNPSLSIFLSYTFIRLNSFHVANDLSTQCDGSVEGTPGETRKKDRQAFQEWLRERMNWFVSKTIKW